MQSYEKYMQKCFKLAKLGAGNVSPNPLVGCVVLDENDKEISTGYHKKYRENHAERDALLKLGEKDAINGTLIVNLEPCSHYGKTPPCADLIIERGLKKVVIAMRDVNPIVAGNGIKKLQNAGIEVVEGVLEKEARELNEIFIKNMQKHKLFVSIKTATTLDGKIATKTGSSKWITSSKAREKVMELRNAYDCVLTTSSTVLVDNPKFDCETKILLDRELKCDFSMQYFKTGKIYVVTSRTELPKAPENIEFIVISEQNGKLNLKELFENLYNLGLRSVFVEAGGTLNGQLIEQNLVDKIYQFVAPKIIGDNLAKSAYSGRDIEEINASKSYTIQSFEMYEPDVLITLKCNN